MKMTIKIRILNNKIYNNKQKFKNNKRKLSKKSKKGFNNRENKRNSIFKALIKIKKIKILIQKLEKFLLVKRIILLHQLKIILA
jgi:hypothetical protein